MKSWSLLSPQTYKCSQEDLILSRKLVIDECRQMVQEHELRCMPCHLHEDLAETKNAVNAHKIANTIDMEGTACNVDRSEDKVEICVTCHQPKTNLML